MKARFLKMAAVVVSLVMCVCAKAQDVQMATLQHGDNMTAYYGYTALKEAMETAEGGDLITLSGGSFVATSINKVVTIQGAGYVQDIQNNRYKTTIVGNLGINIPEGEKGLLIEGIYCGNVTIYGTIENFILRKCRIGTAYYVNGTSKNCLIDRCRIYTLYPDYHSANFMVKNSILNWVEKNESDAVLFFLNCDITSASKHNDVTAQFKNCIIAPAFKAAGCSAYNCVVYEYYDSGFSSSSSTSNIWMMGDNDIKAIFNNNDFFSFTDEWDYQLTDDAKTTYLGTDGTQVGIYGGTTPFTDVPSNPQVVSKEIATESDANGKLSVRIKVEAQQ